MLKWFQNLFHKQKPREEKKMSTSASIFDVANWFRSKEPMPHKKIQKLCYYYKAWGYALYDKDLLPGEEFEAWVHGPVSPTLYQKYKGNGWNDFPQTKDNSNCFTKKEKELLDSVWETYGEKTANELECISHSEPPWIKARGDLKEFDLSSTPIDHNDMKEYYRSIWEGVQGI